MKSIKYRIRGFVWGFIVATVFWGLVAYPHTTFKISASNLPAAQQIAEDTSINIAQLLPKDKPKQGDNHEKR